MEKKKVCPDCASAPDVSLERRDFLRTVGAGAAAVAAGGLPLLNGAVQAAPTPSSPAETAVSALYRTLTDAQKREICFDWDHRETGGRRRGLLRTFISNNWQITPHHIAGDFYTPQQRSIIHDIFRGVFNPDWYSRMLRQLREDTNGKPWGEEQSIAIFGTPGSEYFEFVMTGRHLTVRADGHTTPHVAFGGPIFYGHAASGFNERVGHPGNVFWEQARRANILCRMLDGRQQRLAMVDQRPDEAAVGFGGPNGRRPGIPVTEMSRDQKEELQSVLRYLLEHYRKEDQDEALACLSRAGGLDRCNLAFYRDGDLGNDGEWDNWRLEGPAFVWYFRGEPHVHVWVNIADDPSLALNSRG